MGNAYPYSSFLFNGTGIALYNPAFKINEPKLNTAFLFREAFLWADHLQEHCPCQESFQHAGWRN
jgi:hypothetical protein